MKRDYSDWEIVEEKTTPDYSEWEVVDNAGSPGPSDFQQQRSADWMGVLGDVLGGAAQVPGNLIKGVTSIPEVLRELQGLEGMGAKRLGQNLLSGLAQGGHQLLNIPSNIAQYAAQRNFISPETAQAVPRHEDYDYNFAVGLNDQRAGDALLQSLSKFATSGFAGGPIRAAIVNALGAGENPVAAAGTLLAPKAIAGAVKGYGNLNRSNVAKGLVESEKAIKKVAKNKYTSIFNEAEEIGANKGLKSPKIDVKAIKKGTTHDRFLKSVEKANSQPTLENLNQAQSDLGKLIRAHTQKGKPGSSIEIEAINKATAAQQKIKDEIYKAFEKKGRPDLVNKYIETNDWYRDNVVPYGKSQPLQQFKRKEKTAEGLVSSLARSDKFKASLAKQHPEVILSHASRGFGKLDKFKDVSGALRNSLIKALKGDK